MVWPTISGMMVERRDQVRSTFFSLREFMPSTRVCRKPSTNGPFFVERAIKFSSQFRRSLAPLGMTPLGSDAQQTASFLAAPVDDKCIRALVVSGLVSACRLAPRGHRMTSAGCLAFAAAVRVIHRV